jgi:hypothetical protein
MTLIHRTSFILPFFLVTGLLPAEDVQRLQLGTYAYDLATLFPKGEFREDRVLARLKNFVMQQESRHKLSRMTIAFRTSDLYYALPKDSDYIPNNYGRDLSAKQFVAQAWCLNGQASAMVKLGENVKYVQLLGDRDPRTIKVGERLVRPTSFLIGGGTRGDQLSSLESPKGAELVRFFAVARPMLSVLEAEQLLATLRSAVRSEQVAVIVRPDAIFSPNGGPYLDVFHPPFPDLSEEAYMATPYIVCLPESETARKKGATQRVCEVTKPTPGNIH